MAKELGTHIAIDNVHLKFFDELQLRGLYIEDQDGDTLLYCDRLRVNMQLIKFRQRNLEFDVIQLDEPHFYLKQFPDTVGGTNLDFIVNYFKPEVPDTTARKQWSLYSDDLRLNNARFKLSKVGVEKKAYGVDFKMLDIRDVFIDMEKVELEKDTLYADVKEISLRDHSGFAIESLDAWLKMSSSSMEFDHLHLITPNSEIHSDISFQYSGFPAFKNFVDSVYIRSDFSNSHLDFTDISYFAPELEGFAQQLEVDGRIRGTVDNIKGSQLKVNFGEHSYFLGDVDLIGLPKIENTFINLNLRKLSTTADDIRHIQIPPFTEKQFIDLPEEFYNLGTITFGGQFTGFYNDFVAYGELRSELGELEMDIGISQDTLQNETVYSGELLTQAFDIGRFLGAPDLGEVTSNVSIEGRGLTLNTIKADVEGEVDQILFRGYSYEGIEMKANLEKNLFNGTAAINDAHLSVDFDGLVDLRGDTAKFDFVSNLYHANLDELNLLKLEEYSSLTSRLEVNVQALSVNDFKGVATAYATSFCVGDEEESEYHLGNLELASARSNEGQRVLFNSSLADIEVVGRFELNTLANGLLSAVHSVLPSLIIDDEEEWLVEDQQFEFSINLKNFTPISELFLPALDFSSNTEISGRYDSGRMQFNLLLNADSFRYGGLRFSEIRLDAEKNSDVLGVHLTSSNLPLADSLRLSEIDFRAIAYQDAVRADVAFVDQDNHTSQIPIEADFLSRKKFDLRLMPADIWMLGQHWQNDSVGDIQIDTTSFRFDDVLFTSENRRIELDGTISESMEERLHFELVEFDVQILNVLTGPKVPRFYGVLNATGDLESAREGSAINANVDLRDFQLEDYQLGNATLDARWNFREKLLDIDGHLSHLGVNRIDVKGTYNPIDEDSPLNAQIAFNDFELGVLDVLIPAGVSGFEGKLKGNVQVNGFFAEPLFSGELDLQNAGVKIDYLNTKYYLNDKVVVANDYIGFDYIPVRDQEGNEGRLIGTLFHENFKNLNYNFYVEMDRFLCLNTTLNDNNLFYGKAYGSGTVDVMGYDDQVQIEVTAATKPGTYFYLPLGGPTEVSLERFVTFISSDEGDEVLDELDLAGITLIMDLQVTPDMQIELVFDESLGDVLRARGSGAISMEITPDGNFTMFGRYEIENGEYLFTLQNIVNKKFSIEKGGVIGWYGDPYNADIDVRAIYKLRASLADLMGEFAESFTSRVPVHLELSLSNKLLNPDVDFAVRLPSADESMQNLVNSVLSSEEEKNKQAFALLVLNRFLPPSNRAVTTTAGNMNIGASTTTEVLSNQLSNWLSQISDDFNIGVNYRPGDNITNEELAVALSTQLLNNRLLLSGSFGVSNNPANVSAETNNQVIGDFMAEYLITEEGKLRLKVFSESADYNILQTYRTGSVQGAGVSYQEDFDNFSELACRIRNLLRKKGEKVTCDDL